MTSNLLHKFSLVSKTGITLAEFPVDEDIAKSQLAGGIMSALLSFSKEVHNKDLESLQFDDRRIFFLPIHEFFVVLEISTEFSEELVGEVVEELRACAHTMLHDLSEDTITDEQADKITIELSDMAKSIELMGEFGELNNKYFLGAPEIIIFKMTKTEQSFNIVASTNDLQFANIIAKMLSNGNLIFEETLPCKAGIVKFDGFDRGAFVVVKKNGEDFDVGALVVDEDNYENLEALNKKLRIVAKELVIRNKDIAVETLVQKLIDQSQDNKMDIAKNKVEFISLPRLSKDIKDVEKILYCVSTNQKVIVTGERVYVKIIINSLSLFGQHRPMKIIEWAESISDLDIDLTGMSPALFKEFKDAGKCTPDISIVHLDKNKIESPLRQKNKYLKSLYDNVKDNSPTESAKSLKIELQKIYNIAFDVTKFVTLSTKKDTLDKLTAYRNEIKESGKYDLIQNIAITMNPWLNDVIMDQSFDSEWL